MSSIRQYMRDEFGRDVDAIFEKAVAVAEAARDAQIARLQREGPTGRPWNPSPSDLLDRAYAVADDGSPASEERWWATIWPIVKRIESRLRSGAERGDAGDERRLIRRIGGRRPSREARGPFRPVRLLRGGPCVTRVN
jgi:hypothetical protein